MRTDGAVYRLLNLARPGVAARGDGTTPNTTTRQAAAQFGLANNQFIILHSKTKCKLGNKLNGGSKTAVGDRRWRGCGKVVGSIESPRLLHLPFDAALSVYLYLRHRIWRLCFFSYKCTSIFFFANHASSFSLMQGSRTQEALEAPPCAFPLEPRQDDWCLGSQTFSRSPQAPRLFASHYHPSRAS